MPDETILMARLRDGSRGLWLAVALAVVLPVAGAAQTLPHTPSQTGRAPRGQVDHVAAARHIYGALCSSCHEEHIGPNLRGLGLPEQLIVQTVRHGQSAMPAFAATEISDADLAALARIIATSQPKGRSAK